MLGTKMSKEWYLSAALVLLFAVLSYQDSPLLHYIERGLYDAELRATRNASAASEGIVIVAIDDASIKQIGRWPWPRSVLARSIEKLSQAKVIGLQTFLTEPQQDPGLLSLQKLRGVVAQARLPAAERSRLVDAVAAEELALNHDFMLMDRLSQAGNVYMPMYFSIGTPLGRPDGPLPEFVSRNRIQHVHASNPGYAEPYPTHAIEYPLELFGTFAAMGHLNLLPDSDGTVRAEALLLEHYGEFYPSLSLQMVARYLNLGLDDIDVDLDSREIRLGNLLLNTDERLRMLSGFSMAQGRRGDFDVYSLVDVLNDKVPAKVFDKRIVIIGATAVGIGTSYPIPVAESMQAPMLQANIIASMLDQSFYLRPNGMGVVELLLFITIALYLLLVLPGLKAAQANLFSALLFLVLIGCGLLVIASDRIWLQVASPATLLLLGHLLWLTQRFMLTEKQKLKVESSSAQSNRMLGLQFQSQGQLDMAMDIYRKLPVDESVLELIYNLALDFERKRQYNKAVAAYDYIGRHGSGFKDVDERRRRAMQVDNTLVIGSSALSGGATMVMDAMTEKPMLGRYQLERELGRGAMGTVYLASDPRINRVVAIKTLELSSEFDSEQLEGAKQRFFREAETAGRLNHPHIVSVYDIGEEQDLAYIAMEYLQGRDLSHLLADADEELDVLWVLELIAKLADALDYAHRNGVVHRDIKPANIMFDSATGEVKITDFGIARITASNKTRTGTILGTPSYMSPEQILGKPIDGRSDLFSLGIMMYELLTRQQPFSGDSMAALVFAIAHSATPDITQLRPLAGCVKGIIDRALEKDVDARFADGAQMKQALNDCMQELRSAQQA